MSVTNLCSTHTRNPYGSTGRLGGAADYLQRRRHSSRLKRSPLTSPLPHMLAAGSSSAATAVAGLPGSSAGGVIKFEPSTNLDENEEKYILPSSSASHAGLRTEDDENDDDDDGGCMESEQPCDLRLPSHFKLNLVSMALQQAAVAAGAAMISGAAAGGGGGGGVGGTTVAGGGGTSTGMTTATQLQQAALHTIAAVATSHQTHGLHQSHAATHAFMNFPPGTAGGGGDTSPKRRYSSSSGGGGGGVTPVPGSLLTTATGVTGPSAASSTGLTASTPGGGPSTSAIVAPHTPSSTATSSAGSSSVAGISGAGGSGSAGATVGGGGVAGSGGAPANWGGAYTCERCGNSYARPHSLNRHVRFECGVEPKFECPICHKKSKHKHNLVLHMRTHQHR
ncbi:circumsporozoite protein-like [Musca vetustissima]|uniref:circumsporozoite protein-like n=1 Tax=Musca vetustissima TaxID=27455 RepID=UPI002AB6EB5E|nr:circumsporozoite protein-like [Musca vetustissima]